MRGSVSGQRLVIICFLLLGFLSQSYGQESGYSVSEEELTRLEEILTQQSEMLKMQESELRAAKQELKAAKNELIEASDSINNLSLSIKRLETSSIRLEREVRLRIFLNWVLGITAVGVTVFAAIK